MSFFRIRNEPFPISRGLLQELFAMFRISLVTILILIIIRPFGTSEKQIQLLLEFSAIAVATSLSFSMIFNFLLIPLLNEYKWSTFKEITKQIIVLILIGFSLLFYAHFALAMQITSLFVFKFLFFTLVIGIIPISIKIISLKNWLLKKNLAEIELLQKANKFKKEIKKEDQEFISISSDQVKDSIEIASLDLLYIKADTNYIELFYFDTKVVRKKQIRISLINALKQIEHANLKQSHRSYAVNINQVERITTSAQGHVLVLYNKQKIPVSRTYKNEILESINLIC